MFMRSVALACASMSAVAMSAAPMQPAIIIVDEATEAASPKRKVRRAALHGRRYRARGPQAKPKRRRNMVTVGRRVRRKHRRAA